MAKKFPKLTILTKNSKNRGFSCLFTFVFPKTGHWNFLIFREAYNLWSQKMPFSLFLRKFNVYFCPKFGHLWPGSQTFRNYFRQKFWNFWSLDQRSLDTLWVAFVHSCVRASVTLFLRNSSWDFTALLYEISV